MKRPEILSPTSSFESVTAALNAGCDAIYIGGKAFGARAFADNPDDDGLLEIAKICKLRGVKVFVTVNTLYKNKELSPVLEFVKKLVKYGVYGVIVQDLGLFYLLKKFNIPLKISASTQMTIHSIDGVRTIKKLGFDRVVLARELGAAEIKHITETVKDIEVEGFIHGAICVAYSGRCLLSSFIGGRSGNRGRCAQPCRMEYSLLNDDKTLTKGYLLSPKDMSTLEKTDILLETGLDSLKIEGRMKSPEYVYLVTSLYRKYIDNGLGGNFSVDKRDVDKITQIFSRGGEHTSYLDSFGGKEMMSNSQKNSGLRIGKVLSYKNGTAQIKLHHSVVPGDGIEIWSAPVHCGTNISKFADDVLFVKIKGNIKKGDPVFRTFDKTLTDEVGKKYHTLTRQQSIEVLCIAKKGENLLLTIPAHDISVEGEKIQEAQNIPTSSEEIKQRLEKTGGTPFSFAVSVNADEDIFIPVSALNGIKRRAIEELENKILRPVPFDENTVYEKKPVKRNDNTAFSMYASTKEQFNIALEFDKIKRIYSPDPSEYDIAAAHEKGKEVFFAYPEIHRGELNKIVVPKDIDGVLLSSHTDKAFDVKTALDHSFNIMNSACIEAVSEYYDPDSYTLSTECDIKELNEISDENSEIIVYGSLPLMITHQCPVGIYCADKKRNKYCSLKGSKGDYRLKDRMGQEYKVERNCDECFAKIMSPVVNALDFKDKLKNMGAKFLRLVFTVEDEKKCRAITEEWLSDETYHKKGEKHIHGHFDFPIQ